jgi:hypothetical protein
MEGIPAWFFLGMLLVFGALAVFGVTSLAALGLSIAGRTRTALIVFASGLLLLAVITSFVPLMAFIDALHDQNLRLEDEALFGMVAMTLFLAGTGQFVAALRKPQSYAVVFGFLVGSLALLVVASFGETDFLANVLGDFNRLIPDKRLPLAMASLFLALACMIIAVLPCRSGLPSRT